MKGITISKESIVAPVSNRGGVGVFYVRIKRLSWPQSLNNSNGVWDTSKKPF